MKNSFFRRVNCLLCDFALSYLFFYLFLFLKPSQLSIVSAFFLILTLYYLITFLVFKRSLFQFLLRIKIQNRQWGYLITKMLLLGIIPFFLIFFYQPYFFILFELLLIVISLIVVLITRKPIWQLLSRATVHREDSLTDRKLRKYSILCIVIISLFAFWNMTSVFSNNKTDIREKNILSLLSGEKFALPVSCFAKKKYVNDINKHKQDPVKYIFNLFEDKDIVIISERLHPEYSQWQLFSQIILNDTFATKIGNICTEFGSISNQQDLENYLFTTFDNEEDLKKATAYLVRENGAPWPLWSNKNIYDFVLNLHEYNIQKDSNQKINMFFSDVPWDWDTIISQQQYFKIVYHGEDRDSIMAVNIISKYKELAAKNPNRKKILVIENTRHAYKTGCKSTTYYIFKEFPEQTTNVYINAPAIIGMPAKAGLWDAVALNMENDTWAINFNDCIMGNDYFDMYQAAIGKRYKDVFDGMIYYKHPKDFRLVHGYNYMLDGFKDTLLRRSAVLGEDYLENEKNVIKEYEEKNIIDREVPLIKLFNFGYACFHSIILLYVLINLCIQYIKLKRLKTKFSNVV